MQVINSVLMDGVVVGEHAHIQNSIVCSNSHLHDHCSLRSCQVLPLLEIAISFWDNWFRVQTSRVLFTKYNKWIVLSISRVLQAAQVSIGIIFIESLARYGITVPLIVLEIWSVHAKLRTVRPAGFMKQLITKVDQKGVKYLCQKGEHIGDLIIIEVSD